MTDKTSQSLLIVGVGTSAGGLEALERFFKPVVPDSRVAYVVIQHLSPDFKSLMQDLLSRFTDLEVIRAEENLPVRGACIYLIPPGQMMTIKAGHLHLTERERKPHLELPIDVFFQSLAQDAGQYAVGVVLSGTGSDGSRGLESIRNFGGLALVQDPETAQFDGMPRAAIETGIAHAVMAPEALNAVIADYMANIGVPCIRDNYSPDSAHNSNYKGIFKMLQESFGLDFNQYKVSTVSRRIERRISLCGLASVEDYEDLLVTQKEEKNHLYRDLLIGVTEFFRDKDAFDALVSQVVKPLLTQSAEKSELRIWVVACATGEEAYSLAMIFNEVAKEQGYEGKITLFATDVHQHSLDTASAGVYSRVALRNVSEERLARYFNQLDEDRFQVSATLRSMVVFAQHNILSMPPFMRIDLLTCRNLLIYFTPETQRRVIALFHFTLKEKAYLFLGASETPGDLDGEFPTIDPKHKIYQKNRSLPPSRSLPVDLKLVPKLLNKTTGRMVPAHFDARGPGLSQLNTLYDSILQRFMPPGFIVDREGTLIHIFGDAGNLLKQGPGKFKQTLEHLLEGEVKLAFCSALQRAINRNERVNISGIRVVTGHGDEILSLEVHPLDAKALGAAYYQMLIVSRKPAVEFSRLDTEAPIVSGVESEIEGQFDLKLEYEKRIHELEQQLFSTQENLQAAIEELQTTNEELQASNEEMMASNEELQSMNEELHSVNEELYTVNAEYERKNVELQILNDDRNNLFGSIEVGIVFLDEQLKIRQFNPAIARMFKIMQHDVGRPIDHIAYALQGRDRMLRHTQQVLETGKTLEAEVETLEGDRYLKRIFPFIKSTGDKGGVIITFTNITQAKKIQRQLEIALEASRQVCWEWHIPSDDMNIFSPGTCILNYKFDNLAPKAATWWKLLHPDDYERVQRSIAQALNGETPYWQSEHRYKTQEGTWSWVAERGKVIERDDSGQAIRMVGTTQDIDITKREREQARQLDALYRAIVEDQDELIVRYTPEFKITFANQATLKFFGFTLDKLKDAKLSVLCGKTQELKGLFADLKPENPTLTQESEVSDHLGTEHWIRWRHRAFFDDQGKVVSYQSIGSDITELYQKQEQLQTSKQEAEAANRAKDEFLSVISHELRTPLTPVLNLTEHLLEVAEGDDVRECIHIINTSSRTLLELINDLLDFVKIESGKFTLEQQDFEVSALCREVFEVFRHTARTKKIELKLIHAPEAKTQGTWVFTDRLKLRQILVNLVSNALKFTHEGSVELSFTFDKKRGNTQFSVKDSGIGIGEADREKLFKPFSQLNASSTSEYGGTGLGLAISQRLAHLLGGAIEFTSVQGEGSTFTLSLPLKVDFTGMRDIASKTVPPFTGWEVDTIKNLRVLVAEDNPHTSFSIRKTLESLGCLVDCVQNGKEAVHAFENYPYDILMLDIGMPVMNGYEAVAAIKANTRKKQVPVIALTARADNTSREQANDSGFDAYMTKPFTKDGMIKLLKKWQQ